MEIAGQFQTMNLLIQLVQLDFFEGRFLSVKTTESHDSITININNRQQRS